MAELDALLEPVDTYLEGGRLFLGLGAAPEAGWGAERFIGRPSAYSPPAASQGDGEVS